jgi:hypothetical protein
MASEIKVDTIVNAGGDNDTGIDLATNDQVKVKIANSEDFIFKANSLEVQTGSNIDMNGTELILDADGDTSITADIDDRIDFKIAGSDKGNIHYDGNDFFSLESNDYLTLVQNQTAERGLIFGPTYFKPYNANDNQLDLGIAAARFNDAFITNGVTTGSDQNDKQDIENLTAKELKVANKLSALFKTYRWKDRVAEKGDKARTHSGIIAQDIQSAFSAEGLDASNYGMFMSNTWTDDDGKEQTRLGVRYPELFSFIFSSIEARLTALESK